MLEGLVQLYLDTCHTGRFSIGRFLSGRAAHASFRCCHRMHCLLHSV